MRNNFKQHLFSMIPRTNIPRSSFNRSHKFKTTMNSGKIIPVLVDEILPGDTVNLRPRAFARLATLAVPVMDDCYIDFFAFFVPNRLVWENWQRFCGEQDNPDDSTDFLIPTITAPVGGFANGSIFDYMGLPTQVGNITVSALPLRGYNLIWNEWFRDENLQDSVVVNKTDSDTYTNYNLLARGKRHDYFTACLPFPQKGNSVTLPLGQTAVLNPVSPTGYFLNNSTNTVGYSSMPDSDANSVYINASGSGTLSIPNASSGKVQFSGFVNPRGTTSTLTAVAGNTLLGTGTTVDLSSATSIDVNDLRMSFQLQKFLERQARGGKKSLCLHVKKIAEKIWKAA